MAHPARGACRRLPGGRWALLAVAVALTVGFVAVRVATHGGRVGALVVAGSVFVHHGPADLPVRGHSTGYDGQFYYRLALDPFTRAVTAYGITLDNPPYRQQRIGLPALAWLVRQVGVPTSVALVLVNAVAVVAVALLGAGWSRRLGRSPWWGLAVAFLPALLIALARDLTEPTATAFLLAGLLLWVRDRRPAAVAVLAAAALCRETVLVVVLGMGAYWVFRVLRPAGGGPSRAAALRRAGLLAVPVAVEVGWQAYLLAVWGEPSWHAAGGELALPLVSALSTLLSGAGHLGLSHAGVLNGIWLVERFALLTVLVLVAVSLSGSALPAELKVAWVFATALATAVGWHADVEFARAANEAVVLGQLVLLGRRSQPADAGLAVLVGWSALAGALYAAAL